LPPPPRRRIIERGGSQRTERSVDAPDDVRSSAVGGPHAAPPRLHDRAARRGARLAAARGRRDARRGLASRRAGRIDDDGDSSGNGNDGVPTGITFGEPGVSGTAYGFTGAPSFVTIPDSPSLNPGGAEFSFTLAVQFTAIPATDYDLLRKGLSSTDGGSYKVEILKKQRGSIAIASCHFIGSAGRAGVGIKQNLADGNWHSITCTKTSASIAITVDGTTKVKSVTIGSIANTMPVWLGAKFKGSTAQDVYEGLMDEVSIQLL
jgi:hypothetical protein